MFGARTKEELRTPESSLSGRFPGKEGEGGGILPNRASFRHELFCNPNIS